MPVSTTLTLTISPDHPALAGHFPGQPIVPGVLLLDETLRLLESREALALTRWRIGRAKFLKPVGPGETLLLAHEHLADGTVRFVVSSGGHAVAKGLLVPATPGPFDGEQER